eukprot:299384_1
MTSIGKQLWYLFVPICMFVAIGMFALINVCVKYKCNKQIRFLGFGWDVVWTIFILLIGNIVSTMLKILACSKVNDEYKHFYDGSQPCFGVLWVIALTFVSLIVILWIVVWILLYRMDATKRDSRKSYLRSVTKSYKIEYWFWEVLLVSRRILIAFMVTIQYVSYSVTQYLLAIILILYLGLHYWIRPFNYDQANVAESLCLFLLIITLMTVIFEFHVTYPQLVSILISAMVLLPIVLIFVYIVLIIKQLFIYNWYKIQAQKGDLDGTGYEARKQKWQMRLTQSQRKHFTEVAIVSDGETVPVIVEVSDEDVSVENDYNQMDEEQDKRIEMVATGLEREIRITGCNDDISNSG